MNATSSFSFENLVVWQKAHQFVLSVYQATQHFPKYELFGLVSQFRRAAVSISANISEGYKKMGKLDKLRFFNVAQGSLEERRNYIILSRDLEYITLDKYNNLREQIEEVSKLLNAYSTAVVNDIGIKDDLQLS
jgi:four helix bundle protein